MASADLSSPSPAQRLPGAGGALALLLGINLFNYLDRYVLAAVEPELRKEFFAPGDPAALAATGSLALWFLVSYMIAAPLCGWLADRVSRWWLVGAAVVVWSLASGAGGLVATFTALVLTRVFVGIGEGGYGPVAPTLIADYYPLAERGQKMSWFYVAIPVGSALGYAFGGQVAQHLGWRWAFFLVTVPGLILGVLCFLRRDPRAARAAGMAPRRASMADYTRLFRIPSFVANTAAMTAMTFAIGGVSFWVPAYLVEARQVGSLGWTNTIFGAITVIMGLAATLAGGWLGDKLRGRVPGSYFVVSGAGMLCSAPFFVAMLYVPFPWAWGLLAMAVFFLFFNTGPSNTALANVSPAPVRATAFALNILCIHLLGDAIAPPLVGWIAGRSLVDGHPNYNPAFLLIAGVMVVSGIIWLLGAHRLDEDTAAAEREAG